jgi:hypothetical protein
MTTMTRSMVMAGLLVAGLAGSSGCEKRRAPTPPVAAEGAQEGEGADRAGEPGASRPRAPRRPADRPRLVPACFESYSECEPAIGFPALSADGSRVAVMDYGPDSPYDARVMVVRVIDVADGAAGRADAVVAEAPILVARDYQGGVDLDTGAVDPAFQVVLDRRVADAEALLDRGDFRSLASLGTVVPGEPGAVRDGMRARFEGGVLTVVDQATGETLWRREIGPGGAAACAGSPVADVSVWVSRAPQAAAVQVRYTTDDTCVIEYPFLVWR